MLLGLGLGLGARRPRAAGGAFAYADLAWSGLWLPNYGGSPWAGIEGRSLTEATNPPATGAAQNGKVPADFDGSNDQLLTGLAWSSFITGTNFFFDAIFRPDTTLAATAYEADASIIGDSNGWCGLAITDDGFTVYAGSSGTTKTRTVARTLGAYTRVQARLAAGAMSIRSNGGAWSATIAVGTIGSIADAVRVGKNFNSSKFIDGRLLHLGISATAFNDAEADQIDAKHVTEYAL